MCTHSDELVPFTSVVPLRDKFSSAVSQIADARTSKEKEGQGRGGRPFRGVARV